VTKVKFTVLRRATRSLRGVVEEHIYRERSFL